MPKLTSTFLLCATTIAVVACGAAGAEDTDDAASAGSAARPKILTVGPGKIYCLEPGDGLSIRIDPSGTDSICWTGVGGVAPPPPESRAFWTKFTTTGVDFAVPPVTTDYVVMFSCFGTFGATVREVGSGKELFPLNRPARMPDNKGFYDYVWMSHDCQALAASSPEPPDPAEHSKR